MSSEENKKAQESETNRPESQEREAEAIAPKEEEGASKSHSEEPLRTRQPYRRGGSMINAIETARITGELLDECKACVRRYIVVSDEQAVILAAWVLHTHAFDAAETTPYIYVTAPDRSCGKTRVMEVLEFLVNNPIRSGGMTPASIVRIVKDRNRPTMLIDEMDSQSGANKEYAEAIRGILNEGFRKKGVFIKCVGDDFKPTEFPVFSPKCFAGIGRLPDTVASRSIPIEMVRKLPGEKVQPFREREVTSATLPIRKALKAWATPQVIRLLQDSRSAPIAGLSDRQNDMAEPLLCIAQLAGDEWLQRLIKSLETIFKVNDSEDQSIGTTLLTDIRSVYDEMQADSLDSETLAENLCEIQESPWASLANGRKMTPHLLARMLRRFRIMPSKFRLGSSTYRGYKRVDFEDLWLRYCSS